MPLPITPASLNHAPNVETTPQADHAGQLAAHTLQQGEPGSPRVQDARHAWEASTRPEPPDTHPPAQPLQPDRLSALGRDLTSHVTIHLRRDEVAALAATSGAVRRAVWAHQPNARMLHAWEQYELERWDEGTELDDNDDEAGQSWQDVYEHLHERLVQADAARFGRTAASREGLNAAQNASAAKFDDLVAALLPTAGDVMTRIARLCQIVERLSPLMAIFVSRGHDAHAQLRQAFAGRACSITPTNYKVEALHAALDEIKRAGPPELQPVLRDIEHALIEQSRFNMTGRARKIFKDLLDALRINNGHVGSRVTVACNNISRLASLRETSSRPIDEADNIISSALHSSVAILGEQSAQALIELQAGLMEINRAGAPETLRPVLGQIDAVLKTSNHAVSDELSAAVIASYGKFDELIRSLSKTKIEVKTRIANACAIIASAGPLIETIDSHGIDVPYTLQRHLRFTIEHCSREQLTDLRLSLDEIAQANPPQLLLPALRHIGTTLEWLDN